MSIAIKSDGELKSIARDFHDSFRTLNEDDFSNEHYLQEVLRELMKRGYTISLHSTLVFDK